MAEKLIFKVPIEYDNSLALNFFKNYCKLSSRMITRLKREKNGIMMNGKLLRTIDFVKQGDVVEINLPDESSQIVPINAPLDIKYEDEYLLIVNKPYDMPVHPVKQHQTDTLANRVTFHMQSRGESYVFRALNRLDKDTSGLVLITKDRYCANFLKNKVNKKYLAICHGKIEFGGTISAPIGLTEHSKMVRYILPNGSPAITHYEVIESYDDLSLISLVLETGRTHQIRCHMSSIGHPLLGDDLYGGTLELLPRQALHCSYLELIHPISGEKLIVNSELPSDMQNILDTKNALRN